MDSKGIVISLIKWGANLPDTATNNDVKAYLKSLDEYIPANDELFILPDEPTVTAAKKRIADAIGVEPGSVVAAKSVLDELELPEGATLAQVHAKIGDFKVAGADSAELTRLKAELQTATEKIVALSAKSDDEKLDALVKKYKAKLPPAKEPWFRALAKRHGLDHAEEVARELKIELPDSAVVDSTAPAVEEATVATTRRVRDRELPVDRDSAVRAAKVKAIQKEKPALSYREADQELTRRESAAS